MPATSKQHDENSFAEEREPDDPAERAKAAVGARYTTVAEERAAVLQAHLYGINNTSDTTAAPTICPVQFSGGILGPTSVDPGKARLDYEEWNTAAGVDLGCHPIIVRYNGTVVSLGIEYSCAMAGGCVAPPGPWGGGKGYLSWSDVSATITEVSQVTFGCDIPRDSGGPASSIVSFSIELTVP